MTAKTVELVSVGENVRYSVEGDELVIRIDTTHRNDVGKPKTIRVASTGGNVEIAGVHVGINAYVYRVAR
jgi:hypothetical protein